MAKKTRRVRRKGAQPRLSDTQLKRPKQAVIQEAPSPKKIDAVKPAEQPKAANFQEEYHYVVKDLQRIGILAAAMLGALLALRFIL